MHREPRPLPQFAQQLDVLTYEVVRVKEVGADGYVSDKAEVDGDFADE
jgi:hypothetical protein